MAESFNFWGYINDVSVNNDKIVAEHFVFVKQYRKCGFTLEL